jgi:alanyl-tRNA synthetase
MEYQKMADGSFSKLPKQNVDFGGGFERIIAAKNNDSDIFKIDVLFPLIKKIEELSGQKYGSEKGKTKAFRVVADHIRASCFIIADGVIPSNTNRGYLLRRLLRRAVRFSDYLGMKENSLQKISEIVKEITKEEMKFRETLELGLKHFEKGEDPFVLFTTYGFPIELALELAKEKGLQIDLEDFNKKMAEHQKLSQTSSAGMFKGGLANHEPKTIRLHTAHHLLLAALQIVLGKNVKQRGSNITEERLRIDFSFDRKMTDEEKKRVEDIVNEKIKEGLKVEKREMKKSDAEKLGAEMEFGAKYGDTVSVYFIEDENSPFSVEFCGGPHVSNTSELGTFKIQKEEASSQGVRRIKAVLI